MDRLGDLSVAERFPIAFWNAGDRRLHRRVLIRANREKLANHFAPIEDRRLIGRAVCAKLTYVETMSRSSRKRRHAEDIRVAA